MHYTRRFVQGFLVTAVLLSGAGCSHIPWQYNYDWGMQSAVKERRRAVVVFTTGSNPESRDLDWKVFSDARVKEMLREFIPVRQDFFVNGAEAKELNVTEVPTAVVVRPDGTIAGSQSGAFTPESFRMFLIRNRFN